MRKDGRAQLARALIFQALVPPKRHPRHLCGDRDFTSEVHVRVYQILGRSPPSQKRYIPAIGVLAEGL